jgi:hypothetical protein
MFNREKFKKLVHYVSYMCEPADLGSTKLNKTCWFSDTIAYTMLGKSITDESYTKQQFGPVPHDILGVVRELQDEGKLVSRRIHDPFGYPKQEYIALEKPNLSMFSAEEISIVDVVMEFVCKEHTAKTISNMSHDRIWELAEIGEEIPYDAVYASRLADIDEEDIKWANEA